MLIQIAAAAGGSHAQYGLGPALQQGGILTWAVFLILVFMSIGSFYILFAKLWEQQKVLSQGQKVRASFWNHGSLADAAAKVDKDTPYRQIVDDGLRAQSQNTMLSDAQDSHDWALVVMTRTRAAIESKLKSGLSFLATVGTTAPFIGLFGTVIGILGALVKIGAAGQASIDTVAGPVGEALIMTAIGLAVAVPAVLAFNWLQARNKMIQENLSTFVNDVNGWMQSNGAVKPMIATRGAAPKAVPAKPATSAPIKA